jgi:hypothetical protein
MCAGGTMCESSRITNNTHIKYSSAKLLTIHAICEESPSNAIFSLAPG